MAAKAETWCDKDKHNLYEYFVDFNEWLESDEALELRQENSIDGLSQPSKALFAGDKEAYDQAFDEYHEQCRREALCENYLCEQFTDDHWYQRNLDHFDQLVQCLELGTRCSLCRRRLISGRRFPKLERSFASAGRTAGIDLAHIEDLLADGQFETVIKEIENVRGRDVFTQEIRDVFSRTGI